jgi:hypothetical protein
MPLPRTGDGRIDHAPSQALQGLSLVGGIGLALIYAKARMTPSEQNLNQARRDPILGQQRIQELVTKQPHEAKKHWRKTPRSLQSYLKQKGPFVKRQARFNSTRYRLFFFGAAAERDRVRVP